MKLKHLPIGKVSSRFAASRFVFALRYAGCSEPVQHLSFVGHFCLSAVFFPKFGVKGCGVGSPDDCDSRVSNMTELSQKAG